MNLSKCPQILKLAFFMTFIFSINSCGMLSTNQAFPNFDGFWKSEGHSFYLAISDNIIQRYQYNAVSCFNAPAGYLPSVSLITKGQINQWASIKLLNPETMLIKRPQDPISLKLKRIKAIPSSCHTEPVNTNLMRIEIIWHTVAENYSYLAERNIDWQSLHKSYREKALELDLKILPDEEQARLESFQLLHTLLSELGDDHSFLMAPNIGKISFTGAVVNNETLQLFENSHVRRDYTNMVSPLSETNVKSIANNKIVLAQPDENTLYINILQLGNFSKKDTYGPKSTLALKKALDVISLMSQQADNIIIDLRFNSGGAIPYANQIASLFSQQTSVTTFLQTKLNSAEENGYTNLKAASYISAHPQSVTNKKTYVLTSNYTASAAEYLTLNLKEVGAIQVGEATRGVFSPVMVRSLPGGWYFSLSNQRMETAKGLTLEGQGVKPDIERAVNLEQSIQNKKDEIIQEIINQMSI